MLYQAEPRPDTNAFSDNPFGEATSSKWAHPPGNADLERHDNTAHNIRKRRRRTGPAQRTGFWGPSLVYTGPRPPCITA
ncbi:hypothetical protein SBA5_160086 [Candidatus Sulfotelmatomonas gaucii]|uniref:Uncharacterized protein n=1 Tax=Candidatus Sulfuritelmatomonas gaucii TaxID=2043161 RepID=A0A2N9L5M7_9BACT|nr:hypothetical protein SBA5_160086 [Candidatus Sulfotelmatomonas gaucii]